MTTRDERRRVTQSGSNPPSEQFSNVVSDCARRFIIVAAAGFGMDGLTDTQRGADH
jgi:hypothetical protein